MLTIDTAQRTGEGAPMEHIDYHRKGVRRHRFLLLAAVSALLLVHFLISAWHWAHSFRDPDIWPRDGREGFAMLSQAAPTFILLALAGIALISSIRRGRFAPWWVGVTVAISVILFAIDTSAKRHQIEVTIASREYWDRGGRARTYFTWWWYNDRWFRSDAK